MNNLFDLTGRAALVTGGSKGLGKAMARVFAQAGADVFISSRHEDELQAAAAEIAAASGRPRRVPRGRHDSPRRRRAAGRRRPSATLGKVDILVNNAGSNCPSHRPDPRRGLGPAGRAEPTSCMALTRALVPRHEGAPLGPDDPHLVDHGPGQHARPQRLFGHQGGPDRPGPGHAPWTWGRTASRSIASPPGRSPPTCRCRSSARSSKSLGRPHGLEPLGPARRAGRPCPAAWPARPAATSPARCWWSTAARWQGVLK